MTIQPVLVAIPPPCTVGENTSDTLPPEPQALACAKPKKSGVSHHPEPQGSAYAKFHESGNSRRLKPAAQLRTPERVIQQRAYARMALRECAKLCGSPMDGWEKGPDEAPLPNEGYYWSVSHKRTWAAAVIADHPVGIDLEHIVPRHEGVFDELASRDEWELLGDRSWHSFFRLWTAKEATLKANGVGIAGFSACRLRENPDDRHMILEYPVGGVPDAPMTWLIEHYIQGDHIAAVTCHGSPVSWCILDKATDPSPEHKGAEPGTGGQAASGTQVVSGGQAASGTRDDKPPVAPLKTSET